MAATPGPGRRRETPARRAADLLRREVLDGAFPHGALPPEAELAQRLDISRNVARDALDLLRAEGLVQRIPGAGTFVVSTKAVQGLDRLRGLAESFPRSAGPVVNEVLAAELVAAPAFVAERLGLIARAPVVFVERLRHLDGVPVSLDTSYLDATLAAGLLGCDLVANDIFVLLEQHFGLALAAADLAIEAVAADHATARHLDVAPGAPLLLLERLAVLEDGRPVDFEFVRYRGDRLSLTARLTRHPLED